MIFWILTALWVINVIASVRVARIRIDWIKMRTWLLEQDAFLRGESDFVYEATQTRQIIDNIEYLILRGQAVGSLIFVIAQAAILFSMFTISLSGVLYIPLVTALTEATALVYTWATIRQYFKTKGMCYAVQANVDAVHIYNENKEGIEHDTELGSTDSGRDSGDSGFRRRQDD